MIGGGNSAGQAALHLSKYAEQVTILVRSPSLAASMSDYLIRQIEAAPNVDVRYRCEVAGGGGRGHLDQLLLRDRDTGETELVPAAGLAGAIFVVVADLLARTLAAPSQIPLGVVTALVGGPFFLLLLRYAGNRYTWS